MKIFHENLRKNENDDIKRIFKFYQRICIYTLT